MPVSVRRHRVGPIPTTTATRTLVEVGSVLPQKRLEEALDSALRQRLTSVDRLRAGVERLGGRGRRGPSALGKVLDARGNACPTDSALETRLGRLLRRHRLPEPERQVMVRDEDGLVGRIDFAYTEQRIAIEVQSYRLRRGRNWDSIGGTRVGPRGGRTWSGSTGSRGSGGSSFKSLSRTSSDGPPQLRVGFGRRSSLERPRVSIAHGRCSTGRSSRVSPGGQPASERSRSGR